MADAAAIGQMQLRCGAVELRAELQSCRLETFPPRCSTLEHNSEELRFAQPQPPAPPRAPPRRIG